jgi:hypothetical protein
MLEIALASTLLLTKDREADLAAFHNYLAEETDFYGFSREWSI